MSEPNTTAKNLRQEPAGSLAAGTAARARRAYQASLPALRALPSRDIKPTNLNVPRMLTACLPHLERLAALEPRLQALPEFDAGLALRAKQYLLAVAQAHAMCLAAGASFDVGRALRREAQSLRRTLRAELMPFVARGNLPKSALDRIKTGRGYRSDGFELQQLAQLLQGPAQASHRASLAATLQEASALAERLFAHAARGRRRPPEVLAATDTRDRAFTVFVRAYTEARRGVTFLCDNGRESRYLLPPLYRARSER